MTEIIPTVVPETAADIQEVSLRYSNFASVLHVDFADGLFAPNSTWLPHTHESGTLSVPGMILEAHLMVQEPRALGARLARAGYTRIIGHVEAMTEVAQTLALWRQSGASEVGLGMLAYTPLESLDPFVRSIDMVQMMTINKIGVQGLPFDERAPERVAELHRKHPALLISVDGGVNETTILPLARAGARRFCAGSVLSKAADPAAMYERLLELASGTL